LLFELNANTLRWNHLIFDIMKTHNYFSQANIFQPQQFYHQQFGCFPFIRQLIVSDSKKYFRKLLALKLPLQTLFTNKVVYVDGTIEIETACYYLPDGIMVYFGGPDEYGSNTITLYYNPKVDFTVVKQLVKINKTKQTEKSTVKLLSFGLGGFRAEYFDIDIPSININDLYNDSLKNMDDALVDKLQEDNASGIAIFHGPPGTGKTTYIKSLVKRCQGKREFLFLSPNVGSHLGEPSFISFLPQIKDNIIVIEDAESLLISRKTANNSVMSNLLNITDGILSQIFNIKIICTLNNDLNHIDTALLRKGRLIAKYEFKKLSIGKSRKLVKKTGVNMAINEPMTLAEIYNDTENDFEKTEKPKIGFQI